MNHEYCNGHMHMIKKGDTLYALSRRYHVPLEVMLRANPYVDVYNLQPGDTVCIPGKKADGCNINLIMPRMGNRQEEMTPDVQKNIAETSVDADHSEEDQERQSHEMTREFDTTVPYDGRYVTEQGDSLQSFLQRMNVSLNDFLEQNEPEDVMLLPGIAYRK